jgi:WD40 repeat protein
MKQVLLVLFMVLLIAPTQSRSNNPVVYSNQADRNLEPKLVFQGSHDAKINRVQWHPNNQYLVSFDRNGTVKIWDGHHQALLASVTIEGLQDVAWVNGSQLVAITRDYLLVYDFNLKKLHEIKANSTNSPRFVRLVPINQGNQVVVIQPRMFTIHDVNSGGLLREVDVKGSDYLYGELTSDQS